MPDNVKRKRAEAMQLQNKARAQSAAPEFSGSILPFSKDAEGNVSFDSDAGIVGLAKRVITLPRDVIAGTVDPRSDEGMRRALEMAATISPLSAATRAAPALVPGARVGAPSRTPARPVPQKAPTQAELKAASDAGYKEAADLGVEFAGARVKTFADDVVRELDEEGFINVLAPKTRALLDELRNPPEGATSSLRSIDAFRKQLNRIAGSPDKTEATAANVVIQRVDRFLEDVAPADVVARPRGGLPAVPGQGTADALAAQAAKILSEARGNAAANFRSGRITGVGNAAELRAAAANSGQNIGNTIRQRLASLILSRKDSRGFSKEELTALRQIVEGTASSNTLRRLSNMLGGGGGLGQTLIASGGAAVGGAAGGVEGAIVGAGLPAGLGALARGGANRVTKKQLKLADELIRSRSPLHESRLNPATGATPGPTQLPEGTLALIRALLAQSKQPQGAINKEEQANFLLGGA